MSNRRRSDVCFFICVYDVYKHNNIEVYFIADEYSLGAITALDVRPALYGAEDIYYLR